MEHPRIETNPDVMAGKPVIKGTRVPVAAILNYFAAGMTAAEIAQAYPQISAEDVRAAAAYAADYLDTEIILAAE